MQSYAELCRVVIFDPLLVPNINDEALPSAKSWCEKNFNLKTARKNSKTGNQPVVKWVVFNLIFTGRCSQIENAHLRIFFGTSSIKWALSIY